MGILVLTLGLAGGCRTPLDTGTGVDASLPLGRPAAHCARSECPVPRALAPGSGFAVSVLDESHASLTAESAADAVATVDGWSRFQGCCTREDADGRCADWLVLPGPLGDSEVPLTCDDAAGIIHYVYSFELEGRSVGQTDIVFRDAGAQVYDLPITVEEPTRFEVTFGGGPDPETLPTVSQLDLAMGSNQLLSLVFRDDAGTEVFGESPTDMQLLDPSVAAFSADGSEPARWWASRTTVRAVSPGQTTLVVDAAGQHAELPVVVGP